MSAISLAKDHPRSRGVYSGWVVAEGSGSGSSPLARGLPAVVTDNITVKRIIPARAGFTEMANYGEVSFEDHPRSRGVYQWIGTENVPRTGSSPLARGLRDFDNYEMLARRIIPARAGFTNSGPEGRTRGEGSSPLARGLRLSDFR